MIFLHEALYIFSEGLQVDPTANPQTSSPAGPDALWVEEMTSVMRNVLSVLSRTSFIQ